MNSVSINDSDIILSENPDAEYRYMIVENRYTQHYNESGDNNIFTGHTNDYLEAITAFTDKVQHNINCIQSIRDLSQRMDVYEAQEEPPQREQHKIAAAPAKKPTLQEKMEGAKEKVREADVVKPYSVEKIKPNRDARE